jgi:hypothetical protein
LPPLSDSANVPFIFPLGKTTGQSSTSISETHTMNPWNLFKTQFPYGTYPDLLLVERLGNAIEELLGIREELSHRIIKQTGRSA